jgi:hypothetical protein
MADSLPVKALEYLSNIIKTNKKQVGSGDFRRSPGGIQLVDYVSQI